MPGMVTHTFGLDRPDLAASFWYVGLGHQARLFFVLFGVSAKKVLYTKHFPVLSSGVLLVCMFYWFVLFF